VLGFLLLSVIGSYALSSDEANRLFAWSFWISEWFALFGFVAIGLNLRFATMKNKAQGPLLKKLVLLYVMTQTADIASTALASWLSFH
jgi:uncharacterized membrane protein YadS